VKLLKLTLKNGNLGSISVTDLVKDCFASVFAYTFSRCRSSNIFCKLKSLGSQVSYAHNCDAVCQCLFTQLLLALVFMLLKGLSAQQGIKLLFLFKLFVKPVLFVAEKLHICL